MLERPAIAHHGGSHIEEVSMRIASFVARLAAVSLGLVSAVVGAGEEAQLVASINAYRAQVQSCAGRAAGELPPLTDDPRLILPADGSGDLRESLGLAAYPLVNAQAISLSGPRDAQAAMATLRQSFCQVVLDPQFVDIGVSRAERDWRIVLARPLLAGRMGDWQAEGQKLLEQINAVRAQPRQCAGQRFAAAPPLAWSSVLGGAAESHSRAMANGNFFDHKDRDGRTPSDRAELAGYTGGLIGENIAAAMDNARKVVDGWLASPGHCANLMNPQFSELGAAYAADPKSDAGIYWTALFGAP
ncbi:hypothetical protein AvCA_18350 [Azotobacter vinelandii CA]|uniref:SCP domain-containing protein n=3 Tax=Azotobacter group TaxID=351 RepID=C1DDS6_AZOVD|nr:conserved hypothetical protein [Azotobacter vinelandii DJ]AGK15157.1 hypothetical protein AvCA_18350 [Azotobacter vinelandii CA]AGK20203.1 hypothetical protein AvCA6_18350 [Azotobacter vinelandii CA6]